MNKTILILALATAVAAGSACSGGGNGSKVGSDAAIEKRIDRILSGMTLTEKIGQMNQVSVGGSDEMMADAIRNGSVGSILNEVDPLKINEMQRIAVEESRLGIPLIVGRDVIHGFKTVFPIPLGIAATFDPGLAEEGARIAALEATACGVRWTFSPMLDIARDPRWGRIAEGSGEDPYLNSRMAVAMVRGYQGHTLDNTSMAACMKHFAGYGAVEGGRDYNSTNIPERLLRNIYLPAFKAAVDAGVMTVMTSFNDNDGIPSTGNSHILKDILRDEWGFDGFVVTDWNSMGEMISHGFAADRKEAAMVAANEGVDMDMMTFGFISHLEELVKEGKVKESVIDNAVRNILRVKILLGLFEQPYVDADAAEAACYTTAALEAARKTAEESVILLKNDGVLPLTGVRKVLVTGPLADAPHDQLGTWAFDGEKGRTVTPLAALRESGLDVVYVPGLAFSRDKSIDFSAVKAAARGVDAILAFVGEEAILSGEAHSLSDINLIGSQSELLKALRETGKPVVATVMAGRPLTVERDLGNVDALLYAFHPGTMGGPALARIILGEAEPGGRTPVTFLRTVGQVPMYYNHNMTGRPYNGEILLEGIGLEAGQTSLGNTSYYLDSGAKPLFPFGYGLTYTTFEYGNVTLDKDVYDADGVIEVSYDITNTGERKGTAVVQVYVRDLVGSIARPVKELKHFERVHLAAGEKKTMTARIPVSELAFWGRDMTFNVEPGEFTMWVGGNSASGIPVGFRVR